MHRGIMRHVDNRLLAAILDAVYALSEARLTGPESTQPAIIPERSRVDLAEHLALTEAVVARDGRLAQRRLIEHFETTASRLGFAPSWRALQGNPASGENPHPQRLPSPPTPSPSALRRGGTAVGT